MSRQKSESPSRPTLPPLDSAKTCAFCAVFDLRSRFAGTTSIELFEMLSERLTELPFNGDQRI
jgi:hypothetical protein